jgi:hypothetical protein
MDEHLLKYRQELIDAKNASQDQLDKALLTLSAGAFGITIAFLESIASSPPIWPALLYVSWFFWGLTIGLSLIAFYLSVKSHEEDLALLHYDPERLYNENRKDPTNTAVKWLNKISLVAFILGLFTISSFAAINLSNYG